MVRFKIFLLSALILALAVLTIRAMIPNNPKTPSSLAQPTVRPAPKVPPNTSASQPPATRPMKSPRVNGPSNSHDLALISNLEQRYDGLTNSDAKTLLLITLLAMRQRDADFRFYTMLYVAKEDEIPLFADALKRAGDSDTVLSLMDFAPVVDKLIREILLTKIPKEDQGRAKKGDVTATKFMLDFMAIKIAKLDPAMASLIHPNVDAVARRLLDFLKNPPDDWETRMFAFNAILSADGAELFPVMTRLATGDPLLTESVKQYQNTFLPSPDTTRH